MLYRFPSSISYSGQGHQVRCVAFRSLFVKESNHGAIVGHAWALVYIGMPDVETTDRVLCSLQEILSLRSAITVCFGVCLVRLRRELYVRLLAKGSGGSSLWELWYLLSCPPVHEADQSVL
jgi:hypothetical protein